MERSRADGTVPQDLERGRDPLRFGVAGSQVEVLGSHEAAQGEIGFQGSPRRADPDDATALAKQAADLGQGRLLRHRRQSPVPVAQERPSDPLQTVHELVAVPAAVAEPVAVDVPVVAVPDAAQHAVALAGDRVAAERTMHTDGRGRLEVPRAHVVPRQGLVVEDPRRADLHEIAAELALQDPILMASEVDTIMPALRVKVAAAGVAAIKTDAAIALDATVHLMREKRAEVLIAMRALLEPVAAINVAAHFGHVLQVAFPPLIADGTVMRMIEHEPFERRFAEPHGIRVGDRNAGPIPGQGHATHDDLALGVALVFE